MKIVAADGQKWRVRRRILPWRRRLSQLLDGMPSGLDGLSGLGDDPISLIIGIIALIIAIPFLIVLAFVLGEFLLLLLLFPIVLLFRILFRRPWAVDVYRGKEHAGSELVVGWRKAGARVQQIARSLRSGATYPPGSSPRPAEPRPTTAQTPTPAAPPGSADLLDAVRRAPDFGSARAAADRLLQSEDGRRALAHACTWDTVVRVRLVAASAVQQVDRRLAEQTYETVIQQSRGSVQRPMTQEQVDALSALGPDVAMAAALLAALDRSAVR